MNTYQMKILELWGLLSEEQKKEVLYHLDSNKFLIEKASKYKGESTMNFGRTSTCPTCGK